MKNKVDMDILRKEQRNIIDKYQKNKIPYNVIFKQLIIMVIISLVAIVNPIELKEKLELSLAILGISIIFIVINYVLIYIFKKKGRNKLLRFTCIIQNIFFGIMLKFVFYKITLNQFLIAAITVILYLTVLSIIVLRIKKLAIPAFFMIIVILYFALNYINFINAYVLLFIANSITYSIHLKEAVFAMQDRNYKKNDISSSQIALTFMFIAEIACFFNFMKI